jgi:hypothetical protein
VGATVSEPQPRSQPLQAASEQRFEQVGGVFGGVSAAEPLAVLVCASAHLLVGEHLVYGGGDSRFEVLGCASVPE